MQSGAGLHASVPDSAYEAAGAVIGDTDETYAAELILKVVAPDDEALSLIKSGSVVVGMLNPFNNELIGKMAARGITAFAPKPRRAHRARKALMCCLRKPTSRATRQYCSPHIITRASCPC